VIQTIVHDLCFLDMDLNRTFTHNHMDREIKFSVTYDPQTHSFSVVEDDSINYMLFYNPANKEWTTSEDPMPTIPVNELALLVQQNFGVFV
jgi:hypothetical protein